MREDLRRDFSKAMMAMAAMIRRPLKISKKAGGEKGVRKEKGHGKRDGGIRLQGREIDGIGAGDCDN